MEGSFASNKANQLPAHNYNNSRESSLCLSLRHRDVVVVSYLGKVVCFLSQKATRVNISIPQDKEQNGTTDLQPVNLVRMVNVRKRNTR
jgi:hypothetical protein